MSQWISKKYTSSVANIQRTWSRMYYEYSDSKQNVLWILEFSDTRDFESVVVYFVLYCWFLHILVQALYYFAPEPNASLARELCTASCGRNFWIKFLASAIAICGMEKRGHVSSIQRRNLIKVYPSSQNLLCVIQSHRRLGVANLNAEN